MNTYLNDVVDADRFEDFVTRGLIDSRPHKDNPLLRVFAYAKRVQFDGIWTPETRLARGLILEFTSENDFKNARIVGRGIPKFFTIEQVQEGDWTATKLVDDDENVTVDEHPVIPWDETAFVANKLNGALGLGYIDPSGNVAVSTKGSFASIEATVASRIIRERLDDSRQANLFIHSGYTPLFEIITPERPHPIDYGNLEDLIYLGFVNNSDGHFTPADESHLFAQIGFTIAELMPFGTLREAVAAPYEPNTEGMVVTINDSQGEQHLFKVKPKEYLELRKLFYSLDPKNMKRLLSEMTGEEILNTDSANEINLGLAEAAFSEGHLPLVMKHKNAMYSKVADAKSLASDAKNVFARILETTHESRKPLSLAIKKNDFDNSLLYAVMNDHFNKTHGVYTVAMKNILKG